MSAGMLSFNRLPNALIIVCTHCTIIVFMPKYLIAGIIHAVFFFQSEKDINNFILYFST